MVSAGSVLKIGAVLAALILFYRAGGATGIGNTIGGGILGFTSGITSGVTAAGDVLGGAFGNFLGAGGVGGGGNPVPQQAPIRTAGEVIQATGLSGNVVESSVNPNTQLTTHQKSLLSLAGVFQKLNLGHKVGLQAGKERIVYDNGLGVQPLTGSFDSAGELRVGREGLGPATIAAQQRLAQEYGIVTFDTGGAISNVGSYTAGGFLSPSQAAYMEQLRNGRAPKRYGYKA